MQPEFAAFIAQANCVRAAENATLFPQGHIAPIVDVSPTPNYVIVRGPSGASIHVHAFTLDFFVNGVWIQAFDVEAMFS